MGFQAKTKAKFILLNCLRGEGLRADLRQDEVGAGVDHPVHSLVEQQGRGHCNARGEDYSDDRINCLLRQIAYCDEWLNMTNCLW